MKTYAKTALAFSVVMAMSAAHAANLGQLKVESRSGQNFSATFVVEGSVPQGTSLTARLAPEDVYTRHFMTMPDSAKGLNLALISKEPLTLRVSGTRPATEQAFPLLVELNEGGQVTLRQYNIHLGASGTVEPVAVRTNAPVRAATSAQAAVDPVAQAVEQSRKEAQAAQAARAAQATQSAATATKDEKTMTPLERMQSRNYNLNEPVTVEAGYTPWSLGVLYQKRYPGASVNQVLVALAMHNPEAFPAGNVQQLKSGAKISAPPASLVNSINAQTARDIVQKGLNIEEVAKRPMPVQTAQAQRRGTSGQATGQASREAAQPRAAAAATPATPAVQAAAPATQPAPQTAPQPAPQPAAQPEPVPVETPPQPAASPAREPVLPHDSAIVADPRLAQEPMPTLEIMTEEEEPAVEEESSSWPWYLLIAAMLGAAGFIVWRTKRGRNVDFQSFKRVMSQKPVPRRQEPVAGSRQSPSVTQPQTQPVSTNVGQKAPAAPAWPSARDAKDTTAPLAFGAETVTQTNTPSMSQASSPSATAQVKTSAQSTSFADTTGNVFDLVADDAPEAPATTSSASSSSVGAASSQTAAPVDFTQSAPATHTSQPTAAVKEAPAAQTSMKDSLDMARSFISIGAGKDAVSLLQDVLRNGTELERLEAQKLIDQVRAQSK